MLPAIEHLSCIHKAIKARKFSYAFWLIVYMKINHEAKIAARRLP